MTSVSSPADRPAGSLALTECHLSLAESRAVSIAGITGVVAPRAIGRIAVIGAGTMGVGIAMAFANAGISVKLVDRDEASVERGSEAIRRNYDVTAAKGKLTRDEVSERLALIEATTDIEAAADCDLVIEAVFEDIAVKQELFRRLEAIVRPDAILATNTSRLDVNVIANAVSHCERVVGLHFFSPANVMRLLEVVRPEAVAPDVLATVMDLASRIGKIPVVVGVCEGFVGNRMLTVYWREVGFLLEEGASPAQVDAAMRGFGMAMGPLAMADLAGMDINWAARKRLAPTRPAHLRYSKIADRICERGRFGQKTGAGYYRYELGSRIPIPDPEIAALIEQCAAEAGITRRSIDDSEIVERTVFALVNEAALILDEGIAQRPSDIDLVYVHGYGFPKARGGPLFHADAIGLPLILERIEDWQRTKGEEWRPAELLRRLVREGRSFGDLAREGMVD